MGDQTCHRNETKRPTLSLVFKPSDDYLHDPRRELVKKIQAYRSGEVERSQELREHSRRLAEERQTRREYAQARRLERQRQVERERELAELRRARWLELCVEAAALNLEPDPEWSELQFISALARYRQSSRERELREMEWQGQLTWQKKARARALQARAEIMRRSIARNQELKQPPSSEDLEDLWSHIPSRVRFGEYLPDQDGWREFGREHRSHPQDYWLSKGRHRIKLAVAMAEQLGQHRERGHYPGRGARPPQKQRRTWELAAPRQWRRHQHCEARFDHLFE